MPGTTSHRLTLTCVSRLHSAAVSVAMSSIGTGYDLSASTYSPDGRVFQIEYANKAVENSGTAIGIRCKDGVVFAVERLITSKLHEPSSNKRIFTVDRHVGMVSAGLIADCRKIVSRSRDEAANFRIVMNQAIPLKHLVDRVCGYTHAHTLYSAVRPFGCNVMFGSYGPDGPSLYMMDPAGVAWGYFGCAIGKAKQAAKTEIEKLKTQEMTCLEGLKEAAKIIYTVHDEVKDKVFELEMSWVGEVTGGVHQSIPDDLYQDAVQFAKDAVKESDSEDDI